MASNKKYWQSVEELKDSSIVETLSKNEFVEEIPTVELWCLSRSVRWFFKYQRRKNKWDGCLGST